MSSQIDIQDVDNYIVSARRGALVRKSIELNSDQVGIIPFGSLCTVLASSSGDDDDNDNCRLQLLQPLQGWISRKCLRWTKPQKNFRWVLDLGSWEPSEKEFIFLLETLIHEKKEREAVAKFMNKTDKLRALASRLLARKCCSDALALSFDQILIERTKGGKPFLSASAKFISTKSSQWPNFNFNVSHEGRYVVLAAESRFLVGIDLAAPEKYRKSTTSIIPFTPHLNEEEKGIIYDEYSYIPKFFHTMRNVLAPSEWEYIQAVPAYRDQAKRFRIIWSCKEAFTKARGDGIAFGLSRCQFKIFLQSSSSFYAQVYVDNILLPNWSFRGYDLGYDHIVTVALGSPSDLVDAYGHFKQTFSLPTLLNEDLELLQHSSNYPPSSSHQSHPFSFLSIRDLIPPHLLALYDKTTTQNIPLMAPS